MLSPETIIARCRDLAMDSRRDYQHFHGTDPDAEGGCRPEIEGYFAADFRILRRAGVSEGDKVYCRSYWDDTFFQVAQAESEGSS